MRGSFWNKVPTGIYWIENIEQVTNFDLVIQQETIEKKYIYKLANKINKGILLEKCNLKKL